MNKAMAQRENDQLVILLHGIMKSSKKMKGLAEFLRKNQFDVCNISYPSTKFPLEELVDIIHDEISQASALSYNNISFVGFSMGGLLTRAYLNKYKPDNLGNVVFIGTPNNGSEVADFFKNYKLYKMLCGPAGQQLVTDQEEFKKILGMPDYDFGVVAGNFTVNLLLSRIINKPNDGKVSVESTKLQGMSDHIVLRTSHPFMIRNKKIWQYALNFLNHTKFHI